MRSSTELKDILEQCRSRSSGILGALLAVQESFGHVPVKAIPEIAGALGGTEADVAGVLSFYPNLRTRAPGRHVVQVCMGESCTANHCRRVLREFQELLRVDIGDTTPGGRFTLEKVYCVGNCAVSPSVIIDNDLYGRVTPSEVHGLLERYR
jgi:NADH:ubiquinone oxidoreductase subunit E